MDNLNAEYGLDINLVTYMRLHEALQFAVDSRRNDEALPSQSLDFFLKSFEKGSKPFRRILCYKENSKLKIRNLNTMKTFLNWSDFHNLKTTFCDFVGVNGKRTFTEIDAKNSYTSFEIIFWVPINV
jgi:hypothetical protein